MAITIATAPPQSLQVLTSTVQNWVAHPLTAPAPASAGISFVADEGVDVHLPHPVYNVGLADLASGKGLAAATLISWRYLLSDGETTAMAEIAQSSSASAAQANAEPSHAFSMLNRGPFVSSMVNAVDAAQKNATLQAGNYSIATLSIPALYVVALWLKSPNPGGGTLIPLDPSPSFLTAGQSYTEAAFLQAVVPAAEQSQTSGDSAKS